MRRKIMTVLAAGSFTVLTLFGAQQLVANAQPADGATVFPCDADVPQARGAVPGPEQWPPIPLGFDRDKPAPPAPLVPGPDGTLVPKDQLPAFAPDGPNSERRMAGPPPGTQRDVGTRPCGEAVAEIQRQTEQDDAHWVCYLADGRYAGEIILDLADPSQDIPSERKDERCKAQGFDRSTP
ncbi:hypothetical protein GEO20_16255 [Rhodococcus erythropolis]|uniref:hypothetical protein n=1 Tax=Rhodococcus erythropolis TaxID=1833 RepID=UPI0012929D04|nr:hypothetical protein [Rhodococcus erythropolis]MQP33520.1 hypothetical protein [Rhodococcus erythropolis]